MSIEIIPAPAGAGGGTTGYISAGTTDASLGTVIFSNSNGISFGMDAGTITASVVAGGGGITGMIASNATYTSGNVSFRDGNNISFATGTGQAISITHGLQSAGAYLTTAAQSNHSHNFATTTTNGALVVVGTTNSEGATIAVPPFITTAMASNAATISNINVSAGTTSNNLSAITFSNLNGVSFGLNGSVLTGSVAAAGGAQTGISSVAVSNATYTSGQISFRDGNNISFASGTGQAISITHGLQSAGAYLTTARASNDAIGLNTALTANGLSVTANSSGLSINVPAWLTTAAQSNHSHNFATTTTNGSLMVVATTNSAGATVAVPPYITTYAAQTNQTGNFYVSGNTTQLSSTAGLDLRSLSFEGAGIASVGVSNGRVLVSVPSGGGAGDGYNIVYAGTAGTTGTTWSSASASVRINGGNNITVSQNGSNDIVISAAQGGIAAGTQTATSGTLVFANSNGVTFGMSGSSQITASVNAGGGGAFTKTFWYPYNEAVNVMGQQGQATFVINPLPLDDVLHVDRIVFPMYFSNASNSTGTLTVSYWVGMYTKNGSTLSSEASTSFTASLGYAGNNSSGQQRGIRLLTAPWTTTLQQSRYYVGIGMLSTTGGANATLSQVLVSQLNSNVSGLWDVASTRSIQWPIGVGYLSASTTGVPATIGISQIDGTNSLAARPPSWHMISGTV